MGITTPNNYPEIPTFYHHDNKSKSQIDYLLNVENQANEGIDSIKIMEHQSLNTSHHVLTTGIINITQGTKKKPNVNLPTNTVNRNGPNVTTRCTDPQSVTIWIHNQNATTTTPNSKWY